MEKTPNHLTQKRLWNKQQFELEEGILTIYRIGLLNSKKLEIKFEDLLDEKTITERSDYPMLIGGVFLMTLATLRIISDWGTTDAALLVPCIGLVFGMCMLIMGQLAKTELVILKNKNHLPIYFFRDKDHAVALDLFLQELFEQRKVYLVDKYWECVDNPDLKAKNLDWLKNTNIINLEEFRFLKQEENQPYTPNKIRPIGFHKECA
jgi:hypothetical protein